MPLIKDGAFADDPWVRVTDDASSVPDDGAIIVGLERWQEGREQLLKRNTPLGVLLKAGQEPKELLADLERLQLVALEFPAFKDGRAYSYARLLRERYGFKGEIRAVGEVLQDQFLFMQRCGIDAFEVSDRASLDDWEQAIGEFSAFYQPGADDREVVLSQRHGRPSRLNSDGDT